MWSDQAIRERFNESTNWPHTPILAQIIHALSKLAWPDHLDKTARRKGVTGSRSTLSYSEHLGAAGWAYALSCRLAILHGYALGVFHFSFGSAFHTIGFHVFTPFGFFKVVLSHTPHLGSQTSRSRYYILQLNLLRFRQIATWIFHLLGCGFWSPVFAL